MPLIKRLAITLVIITRLISVSDLKSQSIDPPFIKYMNHPWVDSVMKTLTIDQQIAQCIWIAGYSNRDVEHEVEISDIIRKYEVGGIVFFQGTASKQAELTNYYQKISKVPLLISLDAEWGIGMRIENVDKFPYQMTLGAIKNDSLIYQFGKAVAAQFKRMGMQMNLAPVADININARNPVINYRSFGENREKVAVKSIMYMKGMQDNGILATAKHFPGHGDTNVDSHLDLPLITHSRLRLDSIELYPFRMMINEGVGSIMTAHLNLPSLDTSSGLPSTLSPVIIKGLLKDELGFRGLVITDAMNMKGVTRFFKTGEADAKALEAGNDVAEFVTDVEATIRETKNYIAIKNLTNDDIALKCRKVLALKYWSGLNILQPVNIENIDKELSPMTTRALIRDLYANALTILNNNQNILPVKNLQEIKIATIAINRNNLTSFQRRIASYHPADQFLIDPNDTASCNSLLKKLTKYDIVIAGVFGLNQRPNMGFGIKPGLDKLLERLIVKNKTIITWFGNPYGIDKIKALQNADGLILAYQENEYTEDLSAQLIFGGIGARGSLPVTINDKWPFDFGIITPGNIRLQYGIPESVGMSSDILNSKIDSIINIGLAAKAFPGCEVMAARKGVVVFQKTYGYQTYDNRVTVQEGDLYDLASVTKVSATLPGLMLLNTEGKFSPDETLGYYLPDFKKTNKGNIVMRDFLTHQAGLTPFIPFWKETLKKDGKFKRNIFDPEYGEKFPQEVAQGLYINKKYKKKMFSEIKKSPIGEKEYLYSDLTFIIAPEIIRELTGQKWNDFVTTNIYQKIGACDIVFNPYLKYPLSRIVPTEYDSLFRKQQLHGTVHDEGAAMLGGISGHAGLFSTANDLMKLMELYRRMGEYGGEQLIGRDVMEEYSRVQFPENNNRRGLGFDKPLLNNSELPQEETYPTRSASPSSFGHSGYTGTFVWIDPEYEITYVFLCNRVYPTKNNNLLSDLNIRTEILQAIYDSIKE
ncbi:MAG TPA: glycoside hydrolase family 3 N-terminal domain-containing protein [Bacteroidales bacterium]|nr:glycoside hydrolase family 3 N-terminal domain-containing protein [Bacteroidales bacterium]